VLLTFALALAANSLLGAACNSYHDPVTETEGRGDANISTSIPNFTGPSADGGYISCSSHNIAVVFLA
jgi:hypothetical protein